MAKYMDVHSGFVGVTESQLREAHEQDLAVEAAEGVHFERTWLDPESGRVFCLSSGPSKEASCAYTTKPGTPPTRSTNCRSRSRRRGRAAGGGQPPSSADRPVYGTRSS